MKIKHLIKKSQVKAPLEPREIGLKLFPKHEVGHKKNVFSAPTCSMMSFRILDVIHDGKKLEWILILTTLSLVNTGLLFNIYIDFVTRRSKLFLIKIHAKRSPLHCSLPLIPSSHPKICRIVMLTKLLMVLIFHFGFGFFLKQKHSPHLVWKSEKRFFKAFSSEASTSNTTFVV